MNCFHFQEDPNHGMYSVGAKIMREVNERDNKRKAGSERGNDDKRKRGNEDGNGNKEKGHRGKDNKRSGIRNYSKYGPGLLGNFGSDSRQEHPN